MSEVIGLAAVRYPYRFWNIVFTNFSRDLFREHPPSAKLAKEKIEELVPLLVTAYTYCESKDKDEACIRAWRRKGYEIIPSTEFLNEDVRGLLENRLRQAVPLRRIRGDGSYDIVVLLRGTCFNHFSDVLEDLKILFEILHGSRRLKKTETLVKELVNKYGGPSVRVVGHSLGAAKGFIITRRLYLEDPENCPEGHFFNLPFMCLETLLRHILHIFQAEYAAFNAALNVFRLKGKFEAFLQKVQALTVKMLDLQHIADEGVAVFSKLENFKPYLYVDKCDRISNKYIPFYRENSGLHLTESNGMSRLTAILKKLQLNARADHLCPSANLIIRTEGISTLNAHPLESWLHVETFGIEVERYTYFIRENVSRNERTLKLPWVTV